jgi:hypothetical protein
MSKVSEALEAWRAAVRDLEAATPWTADWLRARLVEDERRVAYQAIADDAERGDVATDADHVYSPTGRRSMRS